MLAIIPKSDTAKYFLLSMVALFVMTSLLGFSIYKSQSAQAYNRGNIMSNMVYLNKNSMTENEIQKFLEKKKSSLATYAASGTNIPSKKPASYIIWRLANIWGINPQVILATLQKETSLITMQNPESWRYRTAMGYGCPDSKPCNDLYYGFVNQVNMASYQFRYNYEALKGNSQFADGDGDLHGVGEFACNGKTRFYSKALRPGNKVTFYGASGKKDKTITIANEATASFLCYTPHVGPFSETGYSGSDNLVTSFSSWFGPLQGYSKVDDERWMQLKYDTAKYSTLTESATGKVYPKGTQILIKTKVKLDGTLYIRSEYDTSRNNDQGFRYNDLEPLSLEFQQSANPRWMETTEDLKLLNPETDKFIGSTIKKGSQIFFPDKSYRDGLLLVRPQAEADKNSQYTIPYSKLKETKISFVPFETPRHMHIDSSVSVLNVNSGLKKTGTTLLKNSEPFFDQKVKINNKWFYRLKSDTDQSNSYAVDSNYVSQIEYKKIKQPITMSLTAKLAKVIPHNGEKADQGPLSAGTKLTYDSYIVVDGKKYLRSEYDTKHDLNRGFLMDDLKPAFQSLERPRELTMKSDLRKMDAFTGQYANEVWKKGTKRFYPTKIKIDGKWYLRSEYDTKKNTNYVLPYSKLK